MRVTDEQLEAMCVAYYGHGPVAWKLLSGDVKALQMRQMRAALAALPQPEPVPGAAVRFQVTRDEWDDALRLQSASDNPLFDRVNTVLARRPATDEAEARRNLEQCELAREGARFRKDQLRAEIERLTGSPRSVVPLLQQQVEELTAEIEKARAAYADVTASLDTCRAANDRGSAEYTQLREQHEALRAQYEKIRVAAVRAFDAAGTNGGRCREMIEMIELLKPLKPAPAEAEPSKREDVPLWDDDESETCLNPACEDCHGGMSRCTLNREPVQHPPPESAMVEQVESLRLEVRRIERVLRGFASHANMCGYLADAIRDAEAEALDARKGAM